MSDQNFHLQDSFWKFLVSLEELKEKKEILLFTSTLSIDEETFGQYIEFIKKFNLKVEKDNNYIYPLAKTATVKINFSVSEWLALQALIPSIEKKEISNYYHQLIVNKLKTEEMYHKEHVLFSQAETKKFEINSFELLKKKMDYDIVTRKAMKLHFHSQKECDIFPHRLVFIDGALSVVGESIQDKSLVYFELHDIKDIDHLNIIYEPNLSQIEVNEFICNIRLINGKEERLVLKIYSQDETDLLPEHHFLGNPFVTSSTEGDMIWAATIEMCDDVFSWLFQMRDRVEVLDPGHIRKEFAHYCELKNESPFNKKAS